MTLIDKETIRAEIEDRMFDIPRIRYNREAEILLGSYKSLLSFLDTLPDEPNHLEEALELVTEYNLKPYRDGNAWCILLGKDIQSGICGFANTLTATYLDFLKSYKEYKHPIGELLNGLPEQPAWRPSPEQIYSLGTVVGGIGESAFGVSKNLRDLYEQLKKL